MIEDMFYDGNHGLVYTKQSHWPKVCKLGFDRSYHSCYNLKGEGKQTISTIAPLFNYDSTTYPYLLCRTNWLYIIDVKTFEVVEMYHVDLTFSKTQAYYSYRSVTSQKPGNLVTFGARSSSSNYYSGKVFELQIKPEILEQLTNLHKAD